MKLIELLRRTDNETVHDFDIKKAFKDTENKGATSDNTKFDIRYYESIPGAHVTKRKK